MNWTPSSPFGERRWRAGSPETCPLANDGTRITPMRIWSDLIALGRLDVVASMLQDRWNGPIRCFDDDGVLRHRLTFEEANLVLWS